MIPIEGDEHLRNIAHFAIRNPLLTDNIRINSLSLPKPLQMNKTNSYCKVVVHYLAVSC